MIGSEGVLVLGTCLATAVASLVSWILVSKIQETRSIKTDLKLEKLETVSSSVRRLSVRPLARGRGPAGEMAR